MAEFLGDLAALVYGIVRGALYGGFMVLVIVLMLSRR